MEVTCCNCSQWSPSNDSALCCHSCNSFFCKACLSAERGHVCACGDTSCERACCGGLRALCSQCGKRMCEDCANPTCAVCGKIFCVSCDVDGTLCEFCQAHKCGGCNDHSGWFCEGPCGRFSCGKCERVNSCTSCESIVLCDEKTCNPGLRHCGMCSGSFCSRCVDTGKAAQCDGCRKLLCADCDPLAQEPCGSCGYRYCASCLGPEERFTCSEHCDVLDASGWVCATADCAGGEHVCADCGVIVECHKLEPHSTYCICKDDTPLRCAFCVRPECNDCFERPCSECEGRLEECRACGEALCEGCARGHACEG